MTDGTVGEGIRRAVLADVDAVRAVTDAAFRPYIERIGLVPRPMQADHAANVAAGRVFVTGDPVTGLVVVEAHDDHLYLDVIAVHPDALGLPEIRLCTNAMMWENRKMYPRFGYEVVERRVEGAYDRIHYRKRLG
jgi:hypothetical protein